MTQLLRLHPTHPQRRLLKLGADAIRDGGIVAYPTDTTYALGCHIGDKAALNRIVGLRRLSAKHQFTLLCRDLSDLGIYARVDNASYRFLKRHTPGPFTFLLKASREVPRRLVNPKKRTIGLRVPANEVAVELLALLGEPIMTTTLRLPEDEYPMQDGEEIAERLGGQIDIVLDGGACGLELSTVVDLTDGTPEVVRQGAGVLD